MQKVELNRRSDGKVIASEDQKRALTALVDQGHSSAEVARAHGLTVQTVVRWRRENAKHSLRFEQSPLPHVSPANTKEMLAEIRRLHDENQRLRKSIGNIAYEREILQEACNIASKKKWI